MIERNRLALALTVLLALPVAVSAQPQSGFLLETGTFVPTAAGYGVTAPQQFAAPFTVNTPSHVTAVGAGNLSSPGGGTLFAAIVTGLGSGTTFPFADTSVVAFAVFTAPANGGTDLRIAIDATLVPRQYFLVIGSGRFGATGTGLIAPSGTLIGTPGILFSTGNAFVGLGGALRLVVTGSPEPDDTYVVNTINTLTASRASQDSVNAIATTVGTKASQASVDQLGTAIGTANTNILAANTNILTANTNVLARASQSSLDAFSASVATQLSKLIATANAGASQSSIDAFSTSVATEFSKLFAGPDARASQSSLDAFSAGVAAQFSKLLTGADARASQSSVDPFSTSAAAQFSKLFTGGDARASQSSLDTFRSDRSAPRSRCCRSRRTSRRSRPR